MNYISFEIIQCPQKPLLIHALTINTANPSPKKGHPTQLQATNPYKKQSKRAKKNGKSKNTTYNYNGNVWRGKELIVAFVKETLEDTNNDGEDSKSMDPNLHQAFAGPPIQCTPTAIAMFIAQKCFTEECGKSTASAIHAAFLRYYDIM